MQRGGPQHAGWPPGNVRLKDKEYLLPTSPSTATTPSSLVVCTLLPDADRAAENALLAVPSPSRLDASFGDSPVTTARLFSLARLLDSSPVSERVSSLASRSSHLLYPRQKPLRDPNRPGEIVSKMTRYRISESAGPSHARLYSNRFPELHQLEEDFVRKYRPGSVIGSGGFGFVMNACDRETGLEVAVKFLEIARVPSNGWLCPREYPNILDRLKETHILDRVDHPGIVKLVELFHDSLYIYIVQELHGCPWLPQSCTPSGTPLLEADSPLLPSPSSSNVPLSPLQLPIRVYEGDTTRKDSVCSCGECKSKAPKPSGSTAGASRPPAIRRPSHDLFEYIESTDSGYLPESTAKIIFGQLVDVVLYLDRLGIAHNDIKDENILIDEYFRIKLVDFGGATIRDRTRGAPFMSSFFGTAFFAAPEIRRRMVYQTPPAEIWSLGLLLTVMITGKQPFDEDEDGNINGPIVLKVPQDVDMSVDLLSIISRCLKISPLDRISIEALAGHPWLNGWRDELAEAEKTRVVRRDRDAAFLRSKRFLEAETPARVESAVRPESLQARRWLRSFADYRKPAAGEGRTPLIRGHEEAGRSESESDTECF